MRERLAATRRLADADQFTRALPTTFELLRSGFTDAATAQVVLRATAPCSHALATAVDRALGDDLIGATTGRARTVVEREVARQDTAATTGRVAAAIKSRRVEHHPSRDGLGELRLI